jgi:hypothetical protein
VGLSLCLGVRFGDAMSLEGDPVAGVSPEISH